MFSRPRTQVRSKNPVQGRAPGRAGQLVAYGRLFISNVSFYYYPGLIDFSNINYSRTLWGGGKRFALGQGEPDNILFPEGLDTNGVHGLSFRSAGCCGLANCTCKPLD